MTLHPLEELLWPKEEDAADLKERLIGLVRDPYTSQHRSWVSSAYEQLRSRDGKTPSDNLRQGALGFFLFSYHAERWGTNVDASTKSPGIERTGQLNDQTSEFSTANEFLKDPCILDFLYQLYEMPENRFRDSDVTLLALGTTSIILQLIQARLVLKILKPRFLDTKSIESRTEQYQETYEHLPTANSPRIYKSGRRYIVMDFIEGVTVRQYLRMYVWNSGTAQRFSTIREICSHLFQILEEYAELPTPIYHGDISSQNVLVQGRVERGRAGRLYLIDFGHNYLLTERVGSSAEFHRMRAQVPPEVLDDTSVSDTSLMGDVYGLGVLLVEALLDDEYDSVDLYASIDRVYRRYPGLGAILDEMLDPVPERRLEDMPRNPRLYDMLNERISSELELAQRVALDRQNTWVKWSTFAFSLVFPGATDLLDWIHRRTQPGAMEGTQGNSLLGLVALTQALNVTALAIFFDNVRNAGSLEVLSTRLPGWLVALSFSIVATKYYVSIFAGISARGLPGLAELTMRLNSFVFAGPILFVLIIEPKAWPFCSVIGMALVSWNNWTCARLCARASATMSTEGLRVSPDMELARDRYKGWGLLSSIYMTCLLLAGLLLWLNIAQDEFFYAFLVAAVANGKMFLLNCSWEAPLMRTGLDRFVSGYKRALNLSA